MYSNNNAGPSETLKTLNTLVGGFLNALTARLIARLTIEPDFALNSETFSTEATI